MCRCIRTLPVCLAMAALAAYAGCWTRGPHELIVYTALDREFSEPVFEEFTRQTGIGVRAKYDTESTKTVGLVQAILAERQRPRCDVFWNNEVVNTLRLEKEGLLEPFRPLAAARFPAQYRSPDGYWHGFAARARILLVNTRLVPEGSRPRSIFDLTDPQWRGRTAMAKPLFGTTATHAACLFAAWGEVRAKEFFRGLKTNDVQVLAGNKQVGMAVASGQVAFGITDTDDAIGEIEAGMPVAIVYPDQGENGVGTLFIPNTVALLRGSGESEAAKRLVEHLLSAEVESRLNTGPSAQIPLGQGVAAKPRVETPSTVMPMVVDFSAAARYWDSSARFLEALFAR